MVALPDARKGERLIMVTDKHSATRGEFQAYARSKHASELMLPAEVVVLDKLPLLGSGKPDLQTIAENRARAGGGEGGRGGVAASLFASAYDSLSPRTFRECRATAPSSTMW